MPRFRIRPYTQSIAFNGATSVLEKTTPTGINNGTDGSVTMAGWVYLTSEDLSTFGQLYVSGGTSPAFNLGQTGNVYYVFSDRVNTPNNKIITKATFYNYIGLNRWVYMVYVLTSTNLVVYAGGTQIFSDTLGTTINAGTLSSLLVGSGKTTGGVQIQVVSGFMKDVVVFNAALTSQEALNLTYNNIRPSSLASSFLMEEGSGTSIADSTGTNTLTATSISWTSSMLPISSRSART